MSPTKASSTEITKSSHLGYAIEPLIRPPGIALAVAGRLAWKSALLGLT